MKKIYRVSYCDEETMIDTSIETASLSEALKLLAEHTKTATWYSGGIEFVADGKTVWSGAPKPGTSLPPYPFFDIDELKEIPVSMIVDLLAVQADCDDEAVKASRLNTMKWLVQWAIDEGFDLGSIPGLADAAIDAGVKRRNQWNDEEERKHITRDEFINDDDFLVPAYEIGFFEAIDLIDPKLVEATARAAIKYLDV